MSALSVSLCALVLAFCGLTYELIVAQSLAILIGNSVVQYSMTIGLFLASMGFGAMRSREDGDARKLLFDIQLHLCVLAPAGLVLIWFIGISSTKLILYICSGFLIIALGWLTGKELPLLLRLAGPELRLKVLGFDHFGMLFACIGFPIFFLPTAGVFASVFIIAALNALTAIWLAPTLRLRLFATAATCALFGSAVFESVLREWLSGKFLA